MRLFFQAPARHPGWNTTLFAGHFRPDCPQLQQDDQGTHTDEDCLYLNIFVPEIDTPYRNLPVAIFLHGIDYVSGIRVLMGGLAMENYARINRRLLKVHLW